MSVDKALYIGAGLDIAIVKILPHIKRFILVDSQPFSEFGKKTQWSIRKRQVSSCFPCLGVCDEDVNSFFRPDFVTNLKNKAKQEEIELVEEAENYIRFIYKDQIIKYFINTSIPEDIDRIKEDITNFNHLIVIGHDPYLISHCKTGNMTFWGHINTVYQTQYSHKGAYVKQDKVDEKILYNLAYNAEFRLNFDTFNLIDDHGFINRFDNWESYIEFIKKTDLISKKIKQNIHQ